VVAESWEAVSSDTSLMDALGTTAPLASTSRPVIEPVTLAKEETTANTGNTKTEKMTEAARRSGAETKMDTDVPAFLSRGERGAGDRSNRRQKDEGTSTGAEIVLLRASLY
jgi:hypothetical protein